MEESHLACASARVSAPSRSGRKITLVDLATHTSGLPRDPDGFQPKDEVNPWADFTAEALFRLLGSYRLKTDVGAVYGYSNVGYGLLSASSTPEELAAFFTLIDPVTKRVTTAAGAGG